MRALMGLIKDRHGTYYAQRRVPERLQAAVARVLGSSKPRQVFLKKSLGTKGLKDANVRAKPVLIEFDRIIHRATELIEHRNAPKPPQRHSLNATEIARMTEAFYGKMLASDEAQRFGGRAHIAELVRWIKVNEDPNFELPYPIESVREFGWSPEQLAQQRENLVHELDGMREALALGDITAVEDDVAILLGDFQIDLDLKSTSYRELGTRVLQAYVRALEAIEKRNAGQSIETPMLSLATSPTPVTTGGTLRDALEGWKRERERPESTVNEYTRAVEMFVQLHRNLSVADIKRSHATAFREALQMVPKTRKGPLLRAGLPELSQWGREHPKEPKVSAGTVNKQLGAVQAIVGWGFRSGLVPDEVPWSDPFADKRLREELSTRAPFDTRGLQAIFNAALFTENDIPEGGKGPAAIWLPLLALFAGGRLSEFAGLRASDVRDDPEPRLSGAETGVTLLWIVPDKKAGRRLKTVTSERVVPVHSQLVALGFLDFVAACRREGGEKAWLFPSLAPDQGRGPIQAWSKWWSYYLRTHIGIKDRDMVFHSFRHGFTDRARTAQMDAEVRKALMGHSDTSVSGGYGAKDMLARWGVDVLKEAVEKISYPGLDLSRVRPTESTRNTRGTKAGSSRGGSHEATVATLNKRAPKSDDNPNRN
jgi:integrase